MARIFLIGATGGVGSRLHPLLVEAGHEVTGLHRKPEQGDTLAGSGVTPVMGDLMELDAKGFAERIRGHDVVVFSAGAAGSGLDRTTRIDGDAPSLVLEAMRAEGLRRLYLVSVFPEAGRDREPSEGFEHYMREKKRADVAVAKTDLDWVIVRPGTLKDRDGDGLVAAGLALDYGDVARGNVARTLAALVDEPLVSREIIELTDGDEPAQEAVRRLARG